MDRPGSSESGKNRFLIDLRDPSHRNARLLLGWLLTFQLHPTQNLRIFDELRLAKAFEDVFQQANLSEEKRRADLSLLKILLAGNIFREADEQNPKRALGKLLDRDEVKIFIKMNDYEGITYYNKERFEEWLSWQFTAACLQVPLQTKKTDGADVSKIENLSKLVQEILLSSDESQYQLERLKNKLGR